MGEINGVVTDFVSYGRVADSIAVVQTGLGDAHVEFDDFRIADIGGLKIGDHLSLLGQQRYPDRNEYGRVIFYIAETTCVWVNGTHLPRRPEGS